MACHLWSLSMATCSVLCLSEPRAQNTAQRHLGTRANATVTQLSITLLFSSSIPHSC